MWFLVFFGQETSQETLKKPNNRPTNTQRDPKAQQKTTKKKEKKCIRGKKCLKVAISFGTLKNHLTWCNFLLAF